MLCKRRSSTASAAAAEMRTAPSTSPPTSFPSPPPQSAPRGRAAATSTSVATPAATTKPLPAPLRAPSTALANAATARPARPGTTSFSAPSRDMRSSAQSDCACHPSFSAKIQAATPGPTSSRRCTAAPSPPRATRADATAASVSRAAPPPSWPQTRAAALQPHAGRGFLNVPPLNSSPSPRSRPPGSTAPAAAAKRRHAHTMSTTRSWRAPLTCATRSSARPASTPAPTQALTTMATFWHCTAPTQPQRLPLPHRSSPS
mmetsp:Transcript_10972/g.30997  ORF Transcript_10972/g.30997 Transcript_10972/m.30997 type:complete len:260 (+) Transcript_10972:479-1258(+)